MNKQPNTQGEMQRHAKTGQSCKARQSVLVQSSVLVQRQSPAKLLYAMVPKGNDSMQKCICR